jgi:MFS family permease
VLHRVLWLVIAAIPWVLPRGAQPVGLVSLMIVSAVLNHITAPAWFSWMVDLVPVRIRGRYFSRRTQAGQIVGLTLAVAAGFMLDWAEQRSGLALSRMVAVLLAVAAVAGLMDILAFIRVPDAEPPAPRPSVGWRELLREPLANRSFRYYLAFTATLTFSCGYVGQFCWLYMLDVCRVTNMQATLALLTGPQLVALFGIPFWGRMVDRLGCKPVATIACTCVIHGAAVWVLIRPGHWFPGYVGVLVAAFAWSGLELAMYNILLGLVSGTRGAARTTADVAINSVVVATAGTLSGLFGGLVASRLSQWQGHLFGLPLTYHGILFLLAAVFRALALFWLRGIEEPRASSAQAALRHMANDMYANLQETAVAPVRLMGHWTRKLTPSRWRSGVTGAAGRSADPPLPR